LNWKLLLLGAAIFAISSEFFFVSNSPFRTVYGQSQSQGSIPSCKDTECEGLLKNCQPAVMNLTRTNDSSNITSAEYTTEGFDNKGNCKIYVNYYYIPKLGLVSANEDCAVPRNILTVSTVSQLASNRLNGTNETVSPYCYRIGPIATPSPQAPVNQTYLLTIGNQTFPVHYGFLDNTGTVENMTADPSSKSITVTIKDYYDNSSDQERLFSIEFPRVFFNDNMSSVPPGCTEISNGYCVSTVGLSDIPFTVLVKNNDTYLGPHVSGELSENFSRVVSTSYPSGVTEIQITGNYIVPEFSSGYDLPAITAATLAAIMSLGLAARRKRELHFR
jgi:hypothetical protein